MIPSPPTAPLTTPLHFTVLDRESIQPTKPPSKGLSQSLLKSAERSDRFADEIQDLNLRNARLGAWFVMILVPFCSLLDKLAYPLYFWEFLYLRLICAALCVPLLLALDLPAAARYHRAYPVILPVLPAVAICTMIYLTGDSTSGYYVGLLLCLMGTSFVFHWTFREIGLTVGLVIICYFTATVPNLNYDGTLASIGLFINNSIFILLTCVILYFGSRLHHGIRLREFVNRCKVEAQREELRHRNDDLTATLKRLKETEAQLAQSEKLASIGRLSSGIVHEINNPLNFVKSAVYVLRKKTRNMPQETVDAVNEILNDIGEGVDRVASIVSDLRTFAHPESRGTTPVNLRDATTKAMRLMAKQVADVKAQVINEVDMEAVVMGDENHILQILINLMQNSIDAMTEHPEPIIYLSTEHAGDTLLFNVRDNGGGISEEHLQRIFDPFFTTKKVGMGMGLGLSLCYRMMQGMGGRIDTKSKPGEFTEFSLHFVPAPQPQA